jgi:hypothetical protein
LLFHFLGKTIQPKQGASFTAVVSSCKTFSQSPNIAPVVVVLQGRLPWGVQNLPNFEALIGFGVHAQNARPHIVLKAKWSGTDFTRKPFATHVKNLF